MWNGLFCSDALTLTFSEIYNERCSGSGVSTCLILVICTFKFLTVPSFSVKAALSFIHEAPSNYFSAPKQQLSRMFRDIKVSLLKFF